MEDTTLNQEMRHKINACCEVELMPLMIISWIRLGLVFVLAEWFQASQSPKEVSIIERGEARELFFSFYTSLDANDSAPGDKYQLLCLQLNDGEGLSGWCMAQPELCYSYNTRLICDTATVKLASWSHAVYTSSFHLYAHNRPLLNVCKCNLML